MGMPFAVGLDDVCGDEPYIEKPILNKPGGTEERDPFSIPVPAEDTVYDGIISRIFKFSHIHRSILS